MTNSPDLHEQISFVQDAEGSGLTRFDSWLPLRGLKTLALRIERQTESARIVTEHLSKLPGITNVYYPGIGLSKGDSTHAKQASGGGSVISFTTGNADVSKRIVESTDLCSIAVSFGSVHSTISMLCYMSHASIPEALRDRLAPPHDLIRLSVGNEDVDDIVDDLDHAIEAAFGRQPPGIRA